jgi:hypothetical protein
MCVHRHNLVFCQLGRFAPLAVNSGLRPETRLSIEFLLVQIWAKRPPAATGI